MNEHTFLHTKKQTPAPAFAPPARRLAAVEQEPALERTPAPLGGYSFGKMNAGAGAGRGRGILGGGETPTVDAAPTEAPAPAEETAPPATAESPETEAAPAAEEAAAPVLSWEHTKRFTHDALWWFNGERPSGFSTTATLTASGYTDPTALTWRITRGADKVAFSGAPSGETVAIRSTAASRRANDVVIEVSEGSGAGAPSFTGRITVRAPHRLIQRSVNDSASLPPWAGAPAGSVGWWTTIGYRVVDNVGGTIVGATVNENFPGAKTNDQPNNWVNPAAFSSVPVWPNTNGTFIDNWSVWNGSPTPVAPTAANANQSVDHMPHEFYVGSTTSGRGVRVQTHTAHRYLGFARHESITTPAP